MKQLWIPVLAAAALAAWPADAHAFSYTAESMNSWAACDSQCNGNTSLSYTDDQIHWFNWAMQSVGHHRQAWWQNQDVWGTDLTEDSFGGEDHLYVDPQTLYIYSGHGSAPVLSGKQRFRAPFCHTASAASSCRAISSSMRLGERSGPYSGIAGNLRYMILATCFSVDTQPNQQWGDTFRYGVDMVFGYRGISMDSSTTAEVPADFAEIAFGYWSMPFKSAWFTAAEDWWVDDTASLVTAGVNADHAHARRDQMNRYWARRPAGEIHTWRTWSWHQG